MLSSEVDASNAITADVVVFFWAKSPVVKNANARKRIVFFIFTCLVVWFYLFNALRLKSTLTTSRISLKMPALKLPFIETLSPTFTVFGSDICCSWNAKMIKEFFVESVIFMFIVVSAASIADTLPLTVIILSLYFWLAAATSFSNSCRKSAALIVYAACMSLVSEHFYVAT